jgi:hypothetical protein
MEDNRRSAFSENRPHRIRGLLAAGVATWMVLTGFSLLLPLLLGWAGELAAGSGLSLPAYEAFSIVLLAVYVIPIAAMVCLVVGYPLWSLAGAAGMTRRRHASGFGAAAGGIIALLMLHSHSLAGFLIGFFLVPYLAMGRHFRLPDWLRGLSMPYVVLAFVLAGAIAGLTALCVGRHGTAGLRCLFCRRA